MRTYRTPFFFSVCRMDLFQQSLHLGFSSGGKSGDIKLKSDLYFENNGRRAVCFPMGDLLLLPPPRKPLYCLFLAALLTSGFISQTSFLYLTWQPYGACRPFMFALSILCLHSPPRPPTFTSRQAFVKNHRVAGKYLMFFGSCFHIFNKKNIQKSLKSAKNYTCSAAAVNQSLLQ